MTLLIRRIIYISLIILFFIAAPLIILYSLGYSFDWQKKSLVKTGAFYFKSYPNSAAVYLNEKKQSITPLYIKRLLPKEYNVKIEKNGLSPWEKKLLIESQIVTEARNILLVPQNAKIETIENNIAPNLNLNNYFLKEVERKKEDQAKKTASEILKSDSWTISGNKIFYLQPADLFLYQADLDGFNKQQISLMPLAPDIYKISVSLNQKNILALSKSGQLYLFNKEKNLFELIDTGINNADFALDNKKLLYYTTNELWVIYLEKIMIQPYHALGEKELITRFAEKISSAIWYPEDNEHIIFTVGDTIKITELDGRDRRNTVDFSKMNEAFQIGAWNNPQLYYHLDKELLYFINDKNLYSVQIKAPQSIIEATGIFNYGK
jgi:hypothetical protein